MLTEADSGYRPNRSRRAMTNASIRVEVDGIAAHDANYVSVR